MLCSRIIFFGFSLVASGEEAGKALPLPDQNIKRLPKSEAKSSNRYAFNWTVKGLTANNVLQPTADHCALSTKRVVSRVTQLSVNSFTALRSRVLNVTAGCQPPNDVLRHDSINGPIECQLARISCRNLTRTNYVELFLLSAGRTSASITSLLDTSEGLSGD